MKVGQRVVIRDYSEAHGDHGTVFSTRDGLIVVELDDGGALWPVFEKDAEPIPARFQQRTEP